MCKIITEKFKMNKYLHYRTQVLIVHREGVLCILLICKLAPQAESNVSLGLADIPRNLKISKHTGETNHLQYFDYALKQWSPPCGPCELFPNVCISLRIFLTIPATAASAERIFSKLKLVKIICGLLCLKLDLLT